jgi:signal transduction histidine kinase
MNLGPVISVVLFAILFITLATAFMVFWRLRRNHRRFSRALSDLTHDLRSPLAALEIVSSSLADIPEERLVLLRSALARLRDIINQVDSHPEKRSEVQIRRPEGMDAILIDDDPLVRDGWLSRARASGKRLATYGSVGEFRATAATVNHQVPIFVDSALGNDEKGEDFAYELHLQGFHQIYLATGYPPSYFEQMEWLSGIISKDPPDWLFTPAEAKH